MAAAAAAAQADRGGSSRAAHTDRGREGRRQRVHEGDPWPAAAGVGAAAYIPRDARTPAWAREAGRDTSHRTPAAGAAATEVAVGAAAGTKVAECLAAEREEDRGASGYRRRAAAHTE